MLVIDCEWPIESDGIHMVGVNNTDDGSYHQFDDAVSLQLYLTTHPDQAICGHYFIKADMPRLRDHWGIDLYDRSIIDTYTLGCLINPGKKFSHSLAHYGEILGSPKGDFTDFDRPAEGEARDDWWHRMGVYMKQDVELTGKLYGYLLGQLTKYKFSEGCIAQELQVARICSQQVENGFAFDLEKATDLYVMLAARLRTAEKELQEEFPPIVTERYSNKTGKRLKDRVEEFNPGSRIQVANRLLARGVKLYEKTPSGNHYTISDTVLDEISHPAAQTIKLYYMLQKRVQQLDEWFTYYNESTGRIHGDVNPLGTNTHRMSQSKPNLAQIPAIDKPYGPECRRLFCVPDGKKLVGCDASGLELRLLANRLQSEEYREVVEEGDVHTYNMNKAGINDRNKAKTFIYAFIYGAGVKRIAWILGCSVREASGVVKRFVENIPNFREYKESLEEKAVQEGKITLLDGSQILFDNDPKSPKFISPHKYLNYQLQGDGAVAMKRALCRVAPVLDELGAKLVVQAHDEWQIETDFYNCDIVGQAAVKAIESVTQSYDMFVNLTAEYRVGTNWAETH